MIIRERTHTSMQGLRVGKTSESPSSDTTAESEADKDSSILNRRRRLNDYSHPLILLSLSELSNRWLNGFYRSPTNASTAALTAILCVFHFGTGKNDAHLACLDFAEYGLRAKSKKGTK